MANKVVPMHKIIEMRQSMNQEPYNDFLKQIGAHPLYVWFEEHFPPRDMPYLSPENVRDYINSVIQGMPGVIELQHIEFFYRSHPSPLLGGPTVVESDEYTSVRIWWKGRGF